MSATVLSFDFAGKQKFIFATNYLQAIVGASARMDILNKEFQERFRDELIYSAGGNGMAIFQSEDRLDEGERFLREQAMRLGLDVYLSRTHAIGDGFSWEDRKVAMDTLAETKRLAPPTACVFSNPVGSQCQICGRGTVAGEKVGDKDKLACSTCREKLSWKTRSDHGSRAIQAHSWLAEEAYGRRSGKSLFLLEISEMPQTYREWARATNGEPPLSDSDRADTEKSLIAVVCLDANGVGALIDRLSSKPGENSDPAQTLRKLADVIDSTVRSSLVTTMKEVFGENLPNGVSKIPFRPLIAAGDDLTFLIAPELAWRFTIILAKEFEKEANREPSELIKGLTLSAGIGVVHSSYPISEAVDFTEALLANAKKEGKRRLGDGELISPAMVDYEVCLDAKLSDPIMRRWEQFHLFDHIKKEELLLTAKPYRLTDSKPGEASLTEVVEAAEEFGKSGIPRSKRKNLREILKYSRDDQEKLLDPYRRSDSYASEANKLIHWNEKCESGSRIQPALDLIEITDLLPSE